MFGSLHDMARPCHFACVRHGAIGPLHGWGVARFVAIWLQHRRAHSCQLVVRRSSDHTRPVSLTPACWLAVREPPMRRWCLSVVYVVGRARRADTARILDLCTPITRCRCMAMSASVPMSSFYCRFNALASPPRRCVLPHCRRGVARLRCAGTRTSRAYMGWLALRGA